MRLSARRAWLAMLTVSALLGPVTVASPAAAGEVTNLVHVSLTAPASVVVGTTFQMTQVVRNDGPGIWGDTSGGMVRGYTLNNTTGSAFFVQCSTGFINFNSSITCSLPSQIRPGHTARVTYTLRATRIGLVSLESSAEKDDIDTDTNPANNIGRTSTTVVADPRPATPLSTAAAGNPVAYWTPERIREARPADETQTSAQTQAALLNAPAPGDIPAPPPAGPPVKVQPAPVGDAPAQQRIAPASAVSAPWPGRPVDAPARTLGRLYFTTNSLLWPSGWCSAVVVNSENKDLVLTAGHCLHGGITPVFPRGSWHSNFLFIPGTSGLPISAPFGKWTPRQVWTFNKWIEVSRPGSRPWDVGAMLMNTDARGRHIADVTGAQGIAFNQPYGQDLLALGYPETSEDEFGLNLRYCQGLGFFELTTWSDVAMQCDMGSGASGGPRLSGFNRSAGVGFVNSLNAWSFGRNLIGPYFGNDVAGLYNQVRNQRLPLKAISGDWNGDGIDTPGFIRGTTWYLRNSNSGPGPADVVFNWGLATDTPIVGDWNGDGKDGKDGIGVKRGNMWYLANTPGAGTSQQFAWGLASDKPVAGDWDGNGRDGIGVYRAGAWYLANVPGGGTSMQFNWGAATDTPIAGDWDANGKDLVGVRRANTYILSNAPGVTAASYAYGLATDQPIVGDFNNDKRTTYGAVRLNQWYMANALGGATALSFPFG